MPYIGNILPGPDFEPHHTHVECCQCSKWKPKDEYLEEDVTLKMQGGPYCHNPNCGHKMYCAYCPPMDENNPDENVGGT